jgi:hypothetical protein
MGGIMKKYLSVIPLALLLCFVVGCKQPSEGDMASVIKDAFGLKEDDNLEIIEFSLESQEIALVKFRLNGNTLSSKINKAKNGWKFSEIQNKQAEWTPADDYLMIKGRFIDNRDVPIANSSVTLYEVDNKEGKLSTLIKVGKGGILLNPSTKTDAGGNFTIIADRRFWEESGYFTLGVNLLFEEAYLSSLKLKNVPSIIKVDTNTKRFDLGEVKIVR